MSHLPEALLRRYVDEPFVMLGYEKEHLLQCTRCRARLEAIRGNAGFVAAKLNVSDIVNLEAAYRGTLSRTALSDHRHETAPAGQQLSPRSMRWIGGIAAAIAVFFLMGYSPLRGVAQNFLTIFEPQQFQPIGLSSSDVETMRGLPELQAYGKMTESGSTKYTGFGADAAAASVFAHAIVLHPAYVPSGIPNVVMYHVSGARTVTFAFAPSSEHPMPDGLDASTLSATIGPIVIQTYGEKSNFDYRKNTDQQQRDPNGTNAPELLKDMLVITQAPAPKVYSTGATLAQIEAWLISQPGIPPHLAEQIKAIGDPSTTLPVGVEMDKQNAQSVTVMGTSGLMIGDNTGVGSSVLWQKDGTIYSVTGPLAATEILRVADSLTQ